MVKPPVVLQYFVKRNLI